MGVIRHLLPVESLVLVVSYEHIEKGHSRRTRNDPFCLTCMEQSLNVFQVLFNKIDGIGQAGHHLWPQFPHIASGLHPVKEPVLGQLTGQG